MTHSNIKNTKLLRLCLAILLAAVAVGCEDKKAPAPQPHDFGNNDRDKYVCLGDSITYGQYLTRSQSYPAILSRILGKTVVNMGYPGELSAFGSQQADDVLARYQPGYLLILFGANDIIYGYDTDHIIAHLQAIILAAKTNKTIPVIATLTPVYRSHGYMAYGIVELNERIVQLAEDEDVLLADLDAAFNWDTDYLVDDGLHMTPSGAEVIAHTFADVLESSDYPAW